MNRFLISLVFLMVYLPSCVVQTEQDAAPDQVNALGLKVPDGFNYEMYQVENYLLSINTGGSRIASEESIQYAILGTDASENVYGLQLGYMRLTEGLDLSITKPLHLTQLFLYIKYHGNARYFELTDAQISISINDLIVPDEFFTANNGRTESTPACTSFLGNATQIRCRADEIIIKSSASITYIDLLFDNGDTLRTYPETYATNADNNQWSYAGTIAGRSINAIQRFMVFADCQTAPHTLSRELVTFENPCIYSGSIDTDADGVTDDVDVDPLDAQVSAITYIPAKNDYATFAFEDMWPYLGDYDFNDLVVSHLSTVYTNADNYVTKISYDLKVRAIGAKFDNDFCISFSDPNHQVVISQVFPSSLNYELVNLTGLTEFKIAHVHDLFRDQGFINTDSTKNYEQPVEVRFEAILAGNIHLSQFHQDEYLRINQEAGREVHKPGKPYTSLFNTSLMGTAGDDTSPDRNKYFLTADNLPWVLEIPTEWDYPKELVQINLAYPNFKDFSQGKTNLPWYTDSEGNKVHKHLYKKR